MGWRAKAQRTYEARVVEDSLSRLAQVFDLQELPFSTEELQTLAKRARESFKNPERKKGQLDRYKDRLLEKYGPEFVRKVSSALEDINNEIGYEEK